MARFERSRDRKSGSTDRRKVSPRRDFRDSRDNNERPYTGGRKYSGGNPRFKAKTFGRELSMTRVSCASCGEKCEVPFKPVEGKPVYCRDCFSKKDRRSVDDKLSDRDLDVINEKLNKIMKALNIR